jgi:hypothetical protein
MRWACWRRERSWGWAGLGPLLDSQAALHVVAGSSRCCCSMGGPGSYRIAPRSSFPIQVTGWDDPSGPRVVRRAGPCCTGRWPGRVHAW